MNKAQEQTKILYIEDEPYDVTILEETLRSAPDFYNHYALTHAPDLFSGLDKMQTGNFDAVLLDMNLPEGSGRKNIDIIRKFDPAMPIICLTSLNDDQAAMAALQAGAQEYIVKGFSNPYILNRIIRSSIFRKKVENDLLQDARYDSRTGLPNNIFIQQTVSTFLKAAHDWRYKDALLLMRISNFEEIITNYGHEVAREVAVHTAERMKKLLKEEFSGSLNEDEFIIYIRNNARKDINVRSVTLAESLIEACSTRYVIAGIDVEVKVNIGIALTAESGDNYEEILDSAYDAVIVAGNNRGHARYCVASPDFMRPGRAKIRAGQYRSL